MSKTKSKQICLYCGCIGSLEEIKARNPEATSCCPDRETMDLVSLLHDYSRIKAINKVLIEGIETIRMGGGASGVKAEEITKQATQL